MHELARQRLIDGPFFQITDVSGRPHDTRYTCAGRIRDTAIAIGTGARAAKPAAAACLLEAAAQPPA